MTTDTPPTASIDEDLFRRRIVDFLDCAEEDVRARMSRVGSLVTTDIAFVGVAGAFAVVLGAALRMQSPTCVHGERGVFGVDSVRAAGADPDEVRFNQVICAAANEDSSTMFALLYELVGCRGPEDTPEDAARRSAHVMAQLGIHARNAFQATPLDQRWALL